MNDKAIEDSLKPVKTLEKLPFEDNYEATETS